MCIYHSKLDPIYKRRNKVLPMKKKIFEDEDEEDSSYDVEEMVKAMNMCGNNMGDDEAIK